MVKIICPSCSSNKIKYIGVLPASNRFAGKSHSEILSGGGLYSCKQCRLRFRYPRLTKDELDRLYRSGVDNNWSSGEKTRRDWEIVSTIIRKNKSTGRVLDVGCFDGEFLLSLGENYDLSGIEVNSGAVQKAQSSGINIIRQDYEALMEITDRYDVVVAIDVIEHVPNPKEFLGNLVSLLAPGGIVVLSTGNTDSLSWRFMGNRYWYCANPEHISFINPFWILKTCDELGFEVKENIYFSYRIKGLAYRLSDLLNNTVYRLFPWLFAYLRMHGMGKREIQGDISMAYYPPTWLSAKDHFATAIVNNKKIS